jgi:hypothetical protein
MIPALAKTSILCVVFVGSEGAESAWGAPDEVVSDPIPPLMICAPGAACAWAAPIDAKANPPKAAEPTRYVQKLVVHDEPVRKICMYPP